MRQEYLALWLTTITIVATPSAGQRFPAASPKASVAQRVGFCDVDISYHRPRVRGREIWGGLVPFGEVWRTGADYPTVISFSSPVSIEGVPLKAGRYALYSIPNEERWTIIFSRNTELWGAFGYEAGDDALRVGVRPVQSSWTESFTIELVDVRDDTAELTLRWEEIAVPIRLRVDVHEEIVNGVLQAIERGENMDWGMFWKGARYLLEHGRDLGTAMAWIEESIALDKNWMNTWTQAGLLAAQGEPRRAVVVGSEALELCRESQPYCAYQKTYARQLADWAAEANPGEVEQDAGDDDAPDLLPVDEAVRGPGRSPDVERPASMIQAERRRS